ncbi:hypothetical protein BRAO375_2490004 [Bradyrhizobium sp. ORS 375]|nr:hypothetical protein BRAO375_2490004 [Bradyrhizobium sp. ORS 375]
MKEMEVTFGSVVVTAIGTTPPFSAISGASSLILSEASWSRPYSALIASPAFFCLKASSGYLLSLVAANTGAACSTALPRPISATRPAPFRNRRRWANGPDEAVMGVSKRNQRVCRKSTMALISCSVRMRLRPNGGITVEGLRTVSSLRIAVSSARSYRPLRFSSFGPIEPGRSPPLISWQVRQLPLPRSKASFWPSAAPDWAWAAADMASEDMASEDMASDDMTSKGMASESPSARAVRMTDVIKVKFRRLGGLGNIGAAKHKGHRLTMRLCWPVQRG